MEDKNRFHINSCGYYWNCHYCGHSDMKTTENNQQIKYADTRTIITEMLKTAVNNLKRNYDLEYGVGSAEKLLDDYGPVLLGDIIPRNGDPTLRRLLSDMARIVVGSEAGYEVDFVIFLT